MSFTVRRASIVSGTFGSPAVVVQRIPRRRPPGATGDAVLRWGRPGDFQFSAGAIPPAATQPIFIILPGGDEGEDDLEEGLVFTELSRETTTVRISNPADAGDFVDVERIDRITFDGPDGRRRTFVLNNT